MSGIIIFVDIIILRFATSLTSVRTRVRMLKLKF